MVRDGKACGDTVNCRQAAPSMRFARIFTCLLFFLGLAVFRSDAHQVASVELEFQNSDSQWRLLGEMDIAYMLPETRNVPDGLPLSREATMKQPPEELARIRLETENTLRKLLRFTFAGKDIPWSVEFPDFENEPFELPPEEGDIALLTTRLLIDPLPGAGELRVHWAGEQETELIILIEEGDEPRIISTLPGGSLMLLKKDGAGESMTVEKPVADGWLLSGYHHVVPWGLDHILFIVGLFLLAPRWKPLAIQSLLFTLAHSITLAVSVFSKAEIPQRPVEIFIALSIACIGVENLFVRNLGKQRMVLVFIFGLVHGLGYASSLANKLGSVPRGQLAGPLASFNIGVELAQLTVLAGCFLIFLPLRKWTDQVRKTGSILVTLAGLCWVADRLFFL